MGAAKAWPAGGRRGAASTARLDPDQSEAPLLPAADDLVDEAAGVAVRLHHEESALVGGAWGGRTMYVSTPFCKKQENLRLQARENGSAPGFP